jgi:RHS repeat-associated protein
MPFGEEIYRPNQGTDKVRQKFTGYERDAETDLDFAQARMYHKNHGRFTSVDPILMEPERAIDPQRLNLYVYVRNNPLILIDPSGQIIDDSSLKDNKDYQEWKKAYLATKAGKAMWDKYNDDKNFNLTITMGDNAGGKYGAETIINKDSFNSVGKLVSANIILGSEFAKKAASGDYPIGSQTTDTDSSMSSGGTYISRTDRAVGFLAHEFGHVEDANKAGGEKWLKESSLLEQNKANFEKLGAKGLDSPDLLKQCGGCKSISDLKVNREIRAEASSIPTIQQHYGKKIPRRIKDAIKEFNKKYGSP